MTQSPHNITTEDDDPPKVIATVRPAKPEDAQKLLALPEGGGDTRSEWVWIRLSEGTLALATFPQGDTYMQFSDAGVCDLFDTKESS